MNTKKFKSEFILQKITQKNLCCFKLKCIASEFQYKRRRFDTFAFDYNNNSFVIIEYKNKLDCNVLNQSYDYYKLLKKESDVYKAKYNNVFKTSKNDFDIEKTRVMIIGPKFSDKQVKLVETNECPIELWKTTLNENNCIHYKNIITNEVIKLKVSDDELTITENDILKNKSDNVINLYKIIKNRLKNEFEDMNCRYLIDYVSIRKNNELICKIHILKNVINIYLFSTNLKIENGLEDISNKGTGGKANYKLKLNSENTIDYAITLIKKVHDET